MTNILTRDARAGALARRERPVRPGLVLAVVLIGQFMAVLDGTIVNVAAPTILAWTCTRAAPPCNGSSVCGTRHLRGPAW